MPVGVAAATSTDESKHMSSRPRTLVATCTSAVMLALSPVVTPAVRAQSQPGTSAVPDGEGDHGGTRALLDPSRFADLADGLEARVGLDRRLAKDTGASAFASSCVSVGLPGGETLFRLRGDASLIPASTTKLFTGLAALAAIGPDTRLRTEVWEKDGTLYLKGGGDPVLATPDWINAHRERAYTPLADLADRARSARPGADAVVADAGALDTDPSVDGWEARYLRELTAPRISALAADRGRPVLRPQWPKVPNGQDDADLAAASAFAGLYGEATSVRRGSTPEDATMIASIDSPPLSEIVAEMGRHSDNFIAEVLLRHVGRTAGDATTAGGVRAEGEVLGRMGVDLTGVHLADGSGLHRDSLVSCDSFLDLLHVGLADDRLAAAFSGSLAVGGDDGTLAKRDFAGEVRAKTGTLNDVSNLVGVAGSGTGDIYFAILMNDTAATGAGRAHELQDRIVDDVGAWPRP